MQPEFLFDRYPKGMLVERYPEVARLLAAEGIMEGRDELLRFTGLVLTGPGEVYFFLPHGCGSRAPSDRRDAAVRTMSAIARFGKESGRTGQAVGQQQRDALASVISEIATDYRDHGIYSERLRVRTRSGGKPDWKATVRREIALCTSNDTPVYANVRAVRPLNSLENILAVVQAAVVREIHATHAWWLGDSLGTRCPPAYIPPPRLPRPRWADHLRRFMRSLFAERPLRLTRLLDFYLRSTAGAAEGRLVCGLQDFSTVWEVMLRHVLPGVEDGWNARLPVAHYVGRNRDREAGGAMLMDIVARSGTGLMVIDAKYYRALSAASAPGWSDIVKQIYYAEALATVVPRETAVETCFLFPCAESTDGVLQAVAMYRRDGSREARFPTIACHYMPMTEVLAAYTARRTLPSPEWLQVGTG